MVQKKEYGGCLHHDENLAELYRHRDCDDSPHPQQLQDNLHLA